MSKVSASLQHVAIFRLRDVYLIGVLYDFQADNQEGTAAIALQGERISVSIDEADGLANERTALASALVHIVSAAGPVEAFEVDMGAGATITVPVFSFDRGVEANIAASLAILMQTRTSLSLVPSSASEERGVRVAREWGWRGWSAM
jgi:hypothetical protein